MHKKPETFIHKVLHIIERIIAYITLVVLIGMLVLEFYRMFTVPDYFDSVNTYLHNILTIVVGLEFVRMLIDLTPANTIEVLIVAIDEKRGCFVYAFAQLSFSVSSSAKLRIDAIIIL